MEVTLDHVEKLTEDIKMLWFKPEKPVKFVAGQFTELRLPHDNVDDRGDKRWFTLSSSPTEEMLAITTRDSGDQASSFKKKLFSLKSGVRLKLAEPMGDFVLPKDKSIPLVFVAGGIGITPMRSMVRWLTDTGEKRQIHLIYAVRDSKLAVFTELFKDYGANLDIVERRLDYQDIIAIAKPDKKTLIFLSGPEPMIENLYKELHQHGIDKKKLVTDYFPGYDAAGL